MEISWFQVGNLKHSWFRVGNLEIDRIEVTMMSLEIESSQKIEIAIIQILNFKMPRHKSTSNAKRSR